MRASKLPEPMTDERLELIRERHDSPTFLLCDTCDLLAEVDRLCKVGPEITDDDGDHLDEAVR